MHDLLSGSFADLGIVKVIGFIDDTKSIMIHNVELSTGEVVTLFYSLITKKWSIER